MTQESIPRTNHVGNFHDKRLSPAEIRARQVEIREKRIAWIKQTRPERVLNLIDGIPSSFQGRAIKVIAGEGTANDRIRFNCEQCVGWEEVKATVGGCRSYACAFWAVRPYQGEETVEESHG